MSSTVALPDSPGGILYLEQRLRAKVYYQARSQRSVGSNALSKVRPPRSETTCKLWEFMWIYRAQTSHMASYSLGCNAFFFGFAPSLSERARSLSGPVCASSVTLLGIQVLLQIDAELFSKRFEIAQVFVVLTLIFNFGLDTCVSEVSVIKDHRS